MNFAFCCLSPPPVSKTFSWNRSLDREYVWQHHSGTYCMNTLESTVKADHLIRPVFHILGKGNAKIPVWMYVSKRTGYCWRGYLGVSQGLVTR